MHAEVDVVSEETATLPRVMPDLTNLRTKFLVSSFLFGDEAE